MKNFDLNAYGVQEMAYDEMVSVDGGNVFADVMGWMIDVAREAAKWLTSDEVDKIIREIIKTLPIGVSGIAGSIWDYCSGKMKKWIESDRDTPTIVYEEFGGYYA
jgi:hypothetical protein